MSLREAGHRVEEGLIALILGVMTILTFIQVVLRYVFNSGLDWQLKSNYYLFAWLVMIGISYCVRVRAHIGVDAAVRLLPRGPRRAVGIFVLLLALLYTVLMMVGSFDYLHRLYILNVEAEDIPIVNLEAEPVPAARLHPLVHSSARNGLADLYRPVGRL